jgi:hypothetical protein
MIHLIIVNHNYLLQISQILLSFNNNHNNNNNCYNNNNLPLLLQHQILLLYKILSYNNNNNNKINNNNSQHSVKINYYNEHIPSLLINRNCFNQVPIRFNILILSMILNNSLILNKYNRCLNQHPEETASLILILLILISKIFSQFPSWAK